MFLTLQEHYTYLNQLVQQQPRALLISSHKLYAGILNDGRDTSEWGAKYASRTRDFVDSLSAIPLVRILVGIPKYFSCKGDFQCSDCADRYVDTAQRILRHRDKWPNFEWKFSSASHLKCAIAVFPDRVAGVAGSRNLSDADWADISFELDPTNCLHLYEQYNDNWVRAIELTEDNLLVELERQINSVKYCT